jgi:hypothetical protein
MNKGTKKLLIFLSVLFVFFFVLYLLVDSVYVPPKEEIAFPEGELTASIFTSQNNMYEENESLPQHHKFKTVPYIVDVPEAIGAEVGTGTVYQVNDTIYVFVSEYTDQYNVQDIITSQFPVALLISYVPENTKVTAMVDRVGFINGFSAEYIADRLYVSDGTNSQEAAVLGYALDVQDENYIGNHMLVSVCTTDLSEENLAACAQVLSVVIRTVHRDEGLQEELEQQKKREEEAAKKEAEEQAQAQEQTQQEQPDDVSQHIVSTEQANVTEIPITLETDYTNFKLTVSWTLENKDAVFELFLPGGVSYADPSEVTTYGATFNLATGPAGQYTLRIKNYAQLGDITTVIDGIKSTN